MREDKVLQISAETGTVVTSKALLSDLLVKCRHIVFPDERSFLLMLIIRSYQNNSSVSAQYQRPKHELSK